MRRVRSSKCGQTERNFRFNSDSVFMSAKHNTMTPRLILLFIYRYLTLKVLLNVLGQRMNTRTLYVDGFGVAIQAQGSRLGLGPGL